MVIRILHNHAFMGDLVQVAVLGASGFAGGELVRLLLAHPATSVSLLAGKDSAGSTLGSLHPNLASTTLGEAVLEPIDADMAAGRADAAFLCLPHGASAQVAPALLDSGMRVVDLSGDFRLAAEDYPDWYGFIHPAPDRLADAVYGMPELFAEQIAGASLIANPGCFPTPAILGLAPLLRAGLVEAGTIHVDGKTGISGAGRGSGDAAAFLNTHESVRPYRVPRHQHTPEMERGLRLATGLAPTVVFVPHLVPAVRGVVTTSYATLGPGVTSDVLTEALDAAYRDRPFVQVRLPGDMVDAKRTRGTNVVELQAVADGRSGTAIVVGAIDNLVKGAAGQAVQNLNLALDLDETEGLRTVAVAP
jgi:N-acetyl-gamma-glutamyl-phosphate reductase